MNILGPEIWKSHLKETHVTTGYKVLIVTIPTEHTTPNTEAKKKVGTWFLGS